MIKTVRAMVIGLAAITLTACAGQELSKVQGLQPQGSAFTQALYQEYLTLAESEYAEGHYKAADDYARRAAASAEGNAPEPYNPADFNLPAEHVGEIASSRRRLTDALGAGGPDKAPQDMARAQAMFDCWIEEQEEDIQPADIAACRDAFMAAIAKVEEALKPAPMKPMKKAMPPKPDQQDFIVYFDFDKSDLTEEAKAVIAKAVAFANSVKSTIALRGHADRAGSADYNMDLSENRNESVILQMLDEKAKANSVRAVSLGETEPAVPTEDGVRHPKNRRVEISIIPAKK